MLRVFAFNTSFFPASNCFFSARELNQCSILLHVAIFPMGPSQGFISIIVRHTRTNLALYSSRISQDSLPKITIASCLVTRLSQS